MELIGEFETHITVESNNPNEVEKLDRWCRNRNLKCLHIVLDRGATVSQPMLTRRGQGIFASELDVAISLSQDLVNDGFSVVRLKIEAAPDNYGVPVSNLEASKRSSDRYFEHHVKLLLEPATDIASLINAIAKHNAHLSRNALQIGDDGYVERFVTQRCTGVGSIEAKRELDILLEAIATLGYSPLSVTREFVVYDSNLAIDKGWIEA